MKAQLPPAVRPLDSVIEAQAKDSQMIRRIVVCPACTLRFLSGRKKTFCPGCHELVEPHEAAGS
jgi:hypothetical protein